MSDLDEPTFPPTALPVPELDIAPPMPGRVADGTRTRLPSAPPPIPTRAKATVPPPMPSGRGPKKTLPPPIPSAASGGTKSRITAAMPPVNASAADALDPVIEPPMPPMQTPLATPPTATPQLFSMSSASAPSLLGAPPEQPSSSIEVAPELSEDVDMSSLDEPPAVLPPLPRPSQGWMRTTALPPPARAPHQPRRAITRAPFATSGEHEPPPFMKPIEATPVPAPVPTAPAPATVATATADGWDAPVGEVSMSVPLLDADMLDASSNFVKPELAKLDATPLPAPATPDSGDEWPAISEARTETSAVSDLFASAPPAVTATAKPALPPPTAKPALPAPTKSAVLAKPAVESNPDIETSAKPPRPQAADTIDLFAPPAVAEESATTYFERSETSRFNKRYLIAGAAGVGVLGLVVALMVQGGSDAPVKKPIAARHAAPAQPVAAPAQPDSTANAAAAPAIANAPAADSATAPAPAANQAAIAQQAATAQAETPAPAPVPNAAHPSTDIPVTSTPAGATVTLIENGAPRVLGKTPLFASVDPASSYDIVLTLTGHPTTMQHLDPHAAHAIAVSFDSPAAATPVKAMAITTAPAPATATPNAASVATASPSSSSSSSSSHHHHAARVATAAPIGEIASPWGSSSSPSSASSKSKSITTSPAASSSTPATGGPNGILMVASKPPCEIVLDGRVTHLETPQRSLALAPGSHEITFINAKQHINKTVAVQIASKKSTKLIKDFTH